MSPTEDFIDRVLGAPRLMTRSEVADAAGMPLEDARQYWRAMGFADVGDSRAFTERDLEALKVVHRLVSTGVLKRSEAMEVVRSLGQNTSRMAEWQTGTLARLLASQREIPDDTAMREEHVAKVAELTAALLPSLEEMLVYAWRRQLAAAIQRNFDTAGSEDATDAGLQCVGFADLVGFTRLSRRLPDQRLADLVTSFEADSADVVAATGARLIKTLGDEVMFVAEDPQHAVETAFGLHDAHGQGEDCAATAGGPVVRRCGDADGRCLRQHGEPGQPADCAGPAWQHAHRRRVCQRVAGQPGLRGPGVASASTSRARVGACVVGATRSLVSDRPKPTETLPLGSP